MKESRRKGVANHPDPESCGVGRKGDAEALTGARAGEVLSREINVPGTPTPLVAAEGNTGRDVIASPTRAQRGRRASACTETPRTGTGISRGSPRTDGTVERAGKAGGSTPAMYGHGKSDRPVVLRKPSNKGRGAPRPAERVEERGRAKGNPSQQTKSRAQNRSDLQRALERVRQAVNRGYRSSLSRAAPVRHHPRQEPGAVVPHAGICAGGPG